MFQVCVPEQPGAGRGVAEQGRGGGGVPEGGGRVVSLPVLQPRPRYRGPARPPDGRRAPVLLHRLQPVSRRSYLRIHQEQLQVR